MWAVYKASGWLTANLDAVTRNTERNLIPATNATSFPKKKIIILALSDLFFTFNFLSTQIWPSLVQLEYEHS